MTIKEIADTLHLSIASVSKALNGSNDISETTRKAVCEYAASVGYLSRKSKMINGRIAMLWGKGVKQSGAQAEIAQAFCATAKMARYVVVSDEIGGDFDLNEYLAYSHYYGAFLLDINFNSPVYRQLHKTRYPLILLDNYINHDLISGIESDNINAIEEAVDFLVANGHRDIAFLGGERASLVGAERLAGYVLGLARNSIEYRYDLTYFGDYTAQSGADAAEYFLETEKQFTAIICASDVMAIGFIDRMRKAGKQIPQDISVVGYDDLKAVRSAQYDLTTMRQDFELIGERAFRALESSFKGLPSQRITVRCTLIPRGSTRPL